MQQPKHVSRAMYKVLTSEEVAIMLSLEQFDNGAVFTNELHRLKYKGLWFSNRELILQNLESHDFPYLLNASDALKNDKKFMLSAINVRMNAARFIGDKLINDKDIFIKTIKDPDYYTVGEELRNDSNFLLEIIRGVSQRLIGSELIKRFSLRVQDDRDLFIKLVKLFPILISSASHRLRDDYELAELAINTHSAGRRISDCLMSIWRKLSTRLKQDVNLLIAAICASKKTFPFSCAMSNRSFRSSHHLTCFAIEHCDQKTICHNLIGVSTNPTVLLMLCSVLSKGVINTLAGTPFFVKAYSSSSLRACLRIHGW